MNQYPVEHIPHRPEGDTFQLQSSLVGIKCAIFNHKLLIVGIALSVVVLVMLYIKTWPAVFQAEVVIAAEAEEDLQRAAFYQQWNVFRKYSLPDEATLLTSGPVLKEVIEEMDLKYHDVYHPFMSYVVHLWGESWVGQTYRKLKYAVFPRPESPYDVPEEIKERFKVLKDFRAGVSVQQVGDTNIGLVIVRAGSPKVADIANKVVEVYFKQRRERFVKEATSAERALMEEADRAAAELTELENEMKAFYQEKGMYLSYERDRGDLSEWNKLKVAINDLEAHIAQLDSSLQAVNAQLRNEDKEIVSATVLEENVMKAQIIQLEFALEEARKMFQPNAPEIQELEDKIASARSVIERVGEEIETSKTVVVNTFYETLRAKQAQLSADLAGAKAAYAVKRSLSDSLSKQLSLIPEKQQLSESLEREHRLLSNKYNVLKEKLIQAAVSKTTAKTAPSSMRIVEYASYPEKPVWPKTKLMLAAALVVGTLCGIVCALILDLVFAKVNRFRLMSSDSDQLLYGTVIQDPEFTERLFPRPNPVPLLERSSL